MTNTLVMVGPEGAIIAPQRPSAAEPYPAALPASSFDENLVEVLPDYVPADLGALLGEIERGLAAASKDIPPDRADIPEFGGRPTFQVKSPTDRSVRNAREIAASRRAVLDFLRHRSFRDTRAKLADLAAAFVRRQFDRALTIVDQFARLPTDVPTVDAGRLLMAIWPIPIEYPCIRFAPPPEPHGPIGTTDVTLTVPGYAGPPLKVTGEHFAALLTFHDLVSGGSERTFRLGVLRAEIRSKLAERHSAAAAIEHYGAALEELEKLLSSPTVPVARKKFVALGAARAHVAKGDARYRSVRTPSAVRDEVNAAYDAGLAVLAAHGVSRENPLRQHLEKYVAIQQSKVEAGFNVLGFKDGYVPVLRAVKGGDGLYRLANDRIALAADARTKYVEFRSRGEELDRDQAQLALEEEIAALSTQVAAERRAIAADHSKAALDRETSITDALWDLETSSLFSTTAGVLSLYANAVSGNGPGTVQSIDGLVSTGIGYFARRNELRDQLKLARLEIDIARREVTIAGLEEEIADTRRAAIGEQIEALASGTLNAGVFHALANLYEDQAERSLEAAVRWVYLLERAVAFKRLDFDRPPFNFDYRDPDVGWLAAPETLSQVVAEIAERDEPTERTQLLRENAISLRSKYPIEFHRLIQTGDTDFVVSLYDLEKRRPGVYHRRIVRARVEVTGSIPATGFTGDLRNEGFFVIRDKETTLGPPEAPRLLPTSERMSAALENLQSGHIQGDPVDGVIFYLLEPNSQELSGQPPPDDNNPEPGALALFEGHGETGRWHLHIDPDSINLRQITDVLLHFDVVIPQRDLELERTVRELLARYEEDAGADRDLDKIAVFSLRQRFPDAYDTLASGSAAFNLVADDFPGGLTDLRTKTIVAQLVDAEGSGVAAVGLEFAAVGPAFSIARTTGDEGFTEVLEEEIPYVPSEDRVPAVGTWEVRLTDPADFGRIDDLRVFLIYSFRPVGSR